MLVIDRVELILVDQPLQVWELHGHHAAGLQQQLHAPDEIVQVRHVGQDVVSKQQIRLAVALCDFTRRLAAEKLHFAADALLPCDCGNVGRRFDAQHRHVARDEVLQEVAVVAGDLDDEAAVADFETAAHSLGIPACMVDPGIRVGGEIGVFGEYIGRRHELLELHQPALVAQERVQRVKGLRRAELPCLNVRLTQRRHAQIDETVPQGRRTESAARIELKHRIRAQVGLRRTGSSGTYVHVRRFSGGNSCGSADDREFLLR